MNALIVEDIKSTSDLIKERIQKVSSKIANLDQAYTVLDALDLINQNQYDIVFWDINLSTGTSFDILKILSENEKINFESIFITGQKESDFIINALKFSAIDYLFKPLDDGLLAEAIEKATQKRENISDYNQYKIFIQNLVNDQTPSTMAFSLIKGNLVYLDLKNISFIEAEGVVSKIYLNNGNTLYANKNLGFYKPILNKTNGFFLASHSAIINLKQMESFDPKTGIVTFSNQFQIKIARRRLKEFKEETNEIKSSVSLIDKLIRKLKP